MLIIPKFISGYKPGYLSTYGSPGMTNVHCKQHTSKTELQNSPSKAIRSCNFPYLSYDTFPDTVKNPWSHTWLLSLSCYSPSAANPFDLTLTICPEFCFSSLFNVTTWDQAVIISCLDYQNSLTIVPKPLQSVLNTAFTVILLNC